MPNSFVTHSYCFLYFLKVRLKQQLRVPARRGPRVLRRASTVRSGAMGASMRSLRSGYAFAHQHGFGELITTGSMMQIRPRPRSARVRVRPGGAPPTAVQHEASTLTEMLPEDDDDVRQSSEEQLQRTSMTVGVGKADSTPGRSNQDFGLSVRSPDDADEEVLDERLVSACGSAVTRLSTGLQPQGETTSAQGWTDEPTSAGGPRRRSQAGADGGQIELGRIPSRQDSDLGDDRFFDESTARK